MQPSEVQFCSIRLATFEPNKEKARSGRSPPRAIFVSSFPGSIEEGHVLHRLRLTFRVHQDLMPSIQRDRGMVGMTDATLDVNAGIPTHGAPAPTLRLRAAGQD